MLNCAVAPLLSSFLMRSRGLSRPRFRPARALSRLSRRRPGPPVRLELHSPRAIGRDARRASTIRPGASVSAMRSAIQCLISMPQAVSTTPSATTRPMTNRSRGRNDRLRIGQGSDLAVAVVAQRRAELRVVEGEAFGDALDRFDQALPRQGDFEKIVRLISTAVSRNTPSARFISAMSSPPTGAGSGASEFPPAIASMLSLRAVGRLIKLRPT